MKMATNSSSARRGGGGSGDGRERQRPGRAGKGAHGEIGMRLHALYAEAEQEPLPGKLIELLEMLDRAEAVAEAGHEAAPPPHEAPGDRSRR